jgi:hypothetical protein
MNIKNLTLAILPLALISCPGGLRSTALEVPHGITMDLLEGPEARLETWLEEDDVVFDSFTPFHAWPEGQAFVVTPELTTAVLIISDSHDTIAPTFATTPTELRTWLRSTEMLRDWFESPK